MAHFQLNGLGHGTLDAAPLEKLKKSTDNDLCLLPPSKETLSERIYYAIYQAEYLWRQSVEELDILDPEQWGLKRLPTLMNDYSVFSLSYEFH